MTKEIQIKWKDDLFTVLVDDDAHALLSRHTWYIMFSGEHKRPYAFTEIYSRTQGKRMVYMHHLVLGGYRQTDHKNGNSLDNQFENLRPSTNQENGWNKGKPKRKDGKRGSQFKGVVRCQRVDGTVYWRVIIKLSAKGVKPEQFVRLGPFESEIEAAAAYNEEIVKHRGQFAWVNPLPEINHGPRSRDRE